MSNGPLCINGICGIAPCGIGVGDIGPCDIAPCGIGPCDIDGIGDGSVSVMPGSVHCDVAPAIGAEFAGAFSGGAGVGC